MIEFSFSKIKDWKNSVKKSYPKLSLPIEIIVKGIDYPKYIFQSPHYSWNKFYRTELIKKNGILFGKGRYHEDQNFAIKVRVLASRILYSPNNYFYNYRSRRSSSVNRVNLDMLHKIDLNQEVKEFLVEKGCYETLEKCFYEYSTKGLADTYQRLPDEYKQKFDSNVHSFLPEVQYSIYEKLKFKNKSFLQTIFSVKKVFRSGSQYKAVIILGKEIPLFKIF